MDENLIHMLANPYHIKKEYKYIKECLQDEFFRVLLRIFPDIDISKEDYPQCMDKIEKVLVSFIIDKTVEQEVSRLINLVIFENDRVLS